MSEQEESDYTSEEEEEEDTTPQYSEEAIRLANEGIGSLLDDDQSTVDLGSKAGYVLVGKGTKRKKRYLNLALTILSVKKKDTDRKPIKGMTFDLKGNLEVQKNDEDAHYLGRVFTVVVDGTEQIRVYCDTTEDFAAWFEVLNTNKRKLDESTAGGGKKVAAEVNRFEQLWGNSEDVPLAASGQPSDASSPDAKSHKRVPTVTDSLHPPHYQSYLTKRGGTFKTWRKRWFVLEAFTLSYYKREGDKKPKARVSIDPECKVLPSVSNKKIKKKRPNAFCLETHGRTYYLDCDDNATKSDWLFNIRKTIEMAKDAVRGYEHQRSEKERENKRKSMALAASSDDGSNNASGSTNGSANGIRHAHTHSIESRIGHPDEDTTDEDEDDEDAESKEGGPAELDVLPGHNRTSTDGQKSLLKSPEERTADYLSKAQTWNRINETNSKDNTSQVEFYCMATKMRLPKPQNDKRRTSALGGITGLGGGSGGDTPIAASHIRIHQSQFMKDSRFPPNVDLSSLKYSGVGQHLCRSNVIESEAIAVYSRACVLDCPVYGDRAVEISIHVEDPRCRTDVEKPWACARFTLSQLLGSDSGQLRLPLILEGADSSNGGDSSDGISRIDKYGALNNPDRPHVYVCLSDVPYSNDMKTEICKTWGMQAQTYAFRSTNQELVVAREECHESLATFQVPLLYLKLRAAEWVANLKIVKERCEKLLKIFIEQDEARARDMQEAQAILEGVDGEHTSAEINQAKKRLASLKKELGRRQSTEERSKWVITHMQSHNRIVSQYSAAIDLLTPLFQQIPPNAYQNKCISLTFKKSADKKKSALRMLPTNLHLCWWRVYQPDELPVDDQDFETLTSRGIVEAGGAPHHPPGTPGRHSRCSTGMTKSDKRRSMMPMARQNSLDSSVMRSRQAQAVSSPAVSIALGSGESKVAGGSGDDDSDDDEETNHGHEGTNFQKSFYADGKGAHDTVYDTVTFGAPAAHVLGFKKGGLRALLLKRGKLLAGEHEQETENDKYTQVQWFYRDEENAEQGPYDTASMRDWYKQGYFGSNIKTRLETDEADDWIPLEERFPDPELAFPEEYGQEAMKAIREALEEAELAAEFGNDGKKGKKGKDEMRQDAEALNLKIDQRRDLIVCQALSALVLSFGARLEVLGARSDKFLKQLAHVGYLFQVESLVSTHGDEQGMLDDFIEAMKELRKFSFRLSELGGQQVASDLWKKRENLTQIRGRMAATTESSDKYKKLDEAAQILEEHIRNSMEMAEVQWYYCDDDNAVQGPFPASHMKGWYPDYLDDSVRILKEGEGAELWMTIGERFVGTEPFPSPSIAAVRVGKGVQEISIERSKNTCVLTLKVPSHLFAKLPDKLKNGGDIPVFPILIQQGINEFQTISNLTGSRSKIQGVVNKDALKMYRHYMTCIEEQAVLIGLDQDEIDVSRQLFIDFETVVQKENPRKKNVEILQGAQVLTRSLRGGRGTCCKSAKDRTSMVRAAINVVVIVY
jgi:hypothetical protein